MRNNLNRKLKGVALGFPLATGVQLQKAVCPP
jgi:hypothetical protein